MTLECSSSRSKSDSWISWVPLDSETGREENNNSGVIKQVDLQGTGTGSAPKWTSSEALGLVRSRASPTMETPPEGLPSANDVEARSARKSFPAPTNRESWWKEEGAMSAQMRCRSALIMCAIIILIQVALIMVLQAKSVFEEVDMNANNLQDNQLDGSTNFHNRLPRSVSELGGKDDTHVERQANDAQLQVKKSIKKGPGVNPMKVGCRSGHIQNFSPVCDINGCLRRLKVESEDQAELPRPEPFNDHLRAEISYIPGRMNNIHMNIVTIITDMQWHFNIYGSVGELGAHLGKFSSVLSFNYHHQAGERIFISDLFSKSLTGLTRAPVIQFDVFHELMKRRGFQFNSGDPNLKRIYLHDGPSSDITKRLLVDWNLPQFRLFSIDGLDGSIELLQVMEMATCVLRDGGILVVDGIHRDDSKDHTASILAKYFRIHGVSALTPFLAAKNKLYLSTTNWRELYTKYLLERQDLLVALGLRGVTDEEFGPQFTYFRSSM